MLFAKSTSKPTLDHCLHLPSLCSRDSLTQLGLSKAIVTELRHILKRHRPLVIATKSGIGAPTRQPQGLGSHTSTSWLSKEGARGSLEEDASDLLSKEIAQTKEYMPTPWQVSISQM